MGEVADLFSSFGAKIDGSSWAKADSLMAKAKAALDGLDRASDKLASNTKAAQAAARAAAAKERAAAREAAAAARAASATERAAARETRAKERASAAATRAIRSLEREELRAAATQARTAARAEVQRKREIALRERRAKIAKKRSDAVDAEFMSAAGGVAAVGVALAAAAAYFAGGIVKKGVELNVTLEDSKNKVAGLMALAKKTDFNAELANAGILMTNLGKAAAKLPGETSDYVEMLSLIAQPVSQAKLGMKELEQLTISATSTALTMHIDPGQAARDIEGALNGVFNSRDRFTGPLLAARGFSGEEGRSRFNQLSADKRAKEVMAAFNAPQLKDMGAALGKSFSGQLSTAEDAWHRFERSISSTLFEKLTERLVQLNEWLDKNQDKINQVASIIGDALAQAFEFVIDAIQWLAENGEDVWTGIKITVGTLLSPFLAVGLAIYAIIKGITWLVKNFDRLGEIARKAGAAIVDAFNAVISGIAELPIVSQLIDAYEFFAGKGSNHSAAQRKKASDDAKTMTPEDWLRAHPGYDTLPESLFPGGKMRTAPPAARGPSDESALSMRVPSVSAGKGAYAMSIDVGGINVTSNASDPAAVAQEVTKAFDDRLAYHLRRTMDEVA